MLAVELQTSLQRPVHAAVTAELANALREAAAMHGCANASLATDARPLQPERAALMRELRSPTAALADAMARQQHDGPTLHLTLAAGSSDALVLSAVRRVAWATVRDPTDAAAALSSFGRALAYATCAPHTSRRRPPFARVALTLVGPVSHSRQIAAWRTSRMRCLRAAVEATMVEVYGADSAPSVVSHVLPHAERRVGVLFDEASFEQLRHFVAQGGGLPSLGADSMVHMLLVAQSVSRDAPTELGTGMVFDELGSLQPWTDNMVGADSADATAVGSIECGDVRTAAYVLRHIRMLLGLAEAPPPTCSLLVEGAEPLLVPALLASTIPVSWFEAAALRRHCLVAALADARATLDATSAAPRRAMRGELDAHRRRSFAATRRAHKLAATGDDVYACTAALEARAHADAALATGASLPREDAGQADRLAVYAPLLLPIAVVLLDAFVKKRRRIVM